MYGARYSVGMSLPAVAVVSVAGLAVGMWSTLKGGYIEKVTEILCNVFMAFPAYGSGTVCVGRDHGDEGWKNLGAGGL